MEGDGDIPERSDEETGWSERSSQVRVLRPTSSPQRADPEEELTMRTDIGCREMCYVKFIHADTVPGRPLLIIREAKSTQPISVRESSQLSIYNP